MKEKKMKNWIQEHKKEIGLVTIGGAAGIGMTILGRGFYKKIILTSELTLQPKFNKDFNEVGFSIHRHRVFGKPKFQEFIGFKPEDAVTFADKIKELGETMNK